MHKTVFCPAPSTWIDVIEAGFYTSCPGLTADLVKKIQKPSATVKGHLRQTQQNFQSAKTKLVTPPTSNDPVMTSEPPAPVQAKNVISSKTVELRGKVFKDQTGQFPITSNRGSKYVMVLFDEDINAILGDLMKKISQKEIIRVTKKMHEYLTNHGFKPHVKIRDNECPDALKKYFRTNDVEFQLVPPPISIVAT